MFWCLQYSPKLRVVTSDTPGCPHLTSHLNLPGSSLYCLQREDQNENSHFYHFVVELPSCVGLFATPWTAARQASPSFPISQSLLKFMFIKLMMPFNHRILCRPLLLLLSIFPNIRVFPSESALHIRWPKYWSFSFSISPSSEYSGLISLKIDWFDLLAEIGRASCRERVFPHV